MDRAERIKQAARKDVHLPRLDMDVTIRKLNPMDFILADLAVPMPGMDTDDRRQRAIEAVLKRNPDFIAERAEKAVVSGLVEPRAVPDGEEAGEGCVNVSDLGEDLPALVSAIFEFSGLGGGGGSEPFRAVNEEAGDTPDDGGD